MLRSIVEAQQNARFDRAHFRTYGPYSLDFEVVYFVLVTDYNEYMDIQHAINFEVFTRFQADGIEFAFPTQTLFVSAPEHGAAVPQTSVSR
jgi:small-conductance mechanosensitive channel